MRLPSPLSTGLLALLLSIAGALPAPAGVPVFSGYQDTLYCANLPSPTGVALAPDGSGRLFVSLKEGAIEVVAPGGAMNLFAAISPVYTQVECGVLGLCFDPDFIRTHYVYVFVTVSATEQRIIRYTDAGSVGVSKVTLPMILPTAGRNHDGGALGIGPDARLYWAVGDNGIGRGANADLSTLASKVGRANLDGTCPHDNPFFHTTAGTTNNYIWATGFRNPFTMAFQPRTGLLWLDVVGSDPTTGGYEQIFTPLAGEDGGWNVFQGNQPASARYSSPAPRPFAHPVVQYKTDAGSSGTTQPRGIASMARNGGVLSVVLKRPHPYRVGEIVAVQCAGALNGLYLIDAIQGTTGFSAPSEGPDVLGASNTGEVHVPGPDGCIAGGCFYESTAFPAASRGSYFFPDFNSGSIWELRLDALNHPAGISRFLVSGGGITRVALGQDGALYYTDYHSQSLRRIAYTHPAELVVTPTTFRMLEGGEGAFTVRLPHAPEAPVTITIAPPAGTNVTLASESTLTFTPANWSHSQTVRLRSAVTPSTSDETADFTVAAPGYADETARVIVTDTTTRAPAVSATELHLVGGATAQFAVSLPEGPTHSVVLTTRRSGGSPLVSVTSGGALTFTPENWQTPQTVEVTARSFSGAGRSAEFSVGGSSYFRRVVGVTLQGAP